MYGRAASFGVSSLGCTKVPALCKVKSVEYRNRYLKGNCYEALIEKFEEIEPNATRSMVTRKINTFHSNCRTELKKVVGSQKSGAGAYNIQKPSLWYFNYLSFLRDQEVQQDEMSSMDDKGRKNSHEESIHDPVSRHKKRMLMISKNK